MEKAKLTKVQAKLVEEAMKHNDGKEINLVEFHITGAWNSYYKELNDVDKDTFCRALYVGYEIIEPDQVVTVTEEMRKELRMGKKFITLSEPYRMYNEGFENALRIVGIKL